MGILIPTGRLPVEAVVGAHIADGRCPQFILGREPDSGWL